MRINIKEKLKEFGITRYELAKRIDVTYPTITAMYNGKTTSIKLEILESICREFNCTPNDIIISDDIEIARLLEYEHQTKKLQGNNIMPEPDPHLKTKKNNTTEFTKQLLVKNGINFDGKTESEKTLDSIAQKLEEYINTTKQNKD